MSVNLFFIWFGGIIFIHWWRRIVIIIWWGRIIFMIWWHRIIFIRKNLFRWKLQMWISVFSAPPSFHSLLSDDGHAQQNFFAYLHEIAWKAPDIGSKHTKHTTARITHHTNSAPGGVVVVDVVVVVGSAVAGSWQNGRSSPGPKQKVVPTPLSCQFNLI